MSSTFNVTSWNEGTTTVDDVIYEVASGVGDFALPKVGGAVLFETLAEGFDSFAEKYGGQLWESHWEACDAVDASKTTVLSIFTSSGFMWLLLGIAVTCLVSAAIAVCLERWPRPGSIIGLLPITDTVEIISMSYMLDTFDDPGCSMRPLIILYLQMMMVGVWVDFVFLLCWIAFSRNSNRGVMVISVMSWMVTAAVGLGLFLCMHIISGGKLGFDSIKRPFAQKEGTAAAVLLFAMGSFAVIAIRVVGPSLPAISGVAQDSVVGILRKRWRSIFLYSVIVNGALVFGSGMAAAISLPTVGALINGLPTELWASLTVLSESRRGQPGGVGGGAVQLLDSAPIYATLSTVTLFLYKDTSMSLWVCALIGFGAASAIAILAWRLQMGYGLLPFGAAIAPALPTKEESAPLLGATAIELQKLTAASVNE